MYKSLQKLHKILLLEGQNNYADKAVIGGLAKYYPTWWAEADSENIPDSITVEIKAFFETYAAMLPADRERAIRAIVSKISSSVDQNIVSSAPQAEPFTQTAVRPYSKVSSPVKNSNSELTKPSYPKSSGLNAPVKILQGVGEVKSGLFASLGVQNIEDLLYYFPRRYVDYSTLKTINRLDYGDELTIIVTVQSSLTTPIHRKKQARVEVVVSDGTGFLRLVFFRSLKYIQSFEKNFKNGNQLVVSGKVTMYLGRMQMNDPAFEPLDQTHLNTNRITPVYPLTAGLTQKEVRTAVNSAIRFNSSKIQDPFSDEMRKNADLIDLPTALKQVHYPDTFQLLKIAQERLAFDEIFYLQLGVQQQKIAWNQVSSNLYEISDEQIRIITDPLPFTLTNAQIKVIDEIRADLASGHPMNRLIQGDVGSGKTIVSALASAAVNIHGGQTAFMAPTSILAEQHYQSLRTLLANPESNNFPLKESEIRLLTGDTSAQDREAINTGCLDGTIKLLIGTHALIEDPVQFQNLQLAIIDEQHRFGTGQRSALRQKGENPHLLVMSATPIPRSLALTLFGDLDISIIDEMPAGRIPVNTRIVHPINREEAHALIRKEIDTGHQAFIVYPLIEKSEDEDQKAAVDEHAYLQKEVFSDLKLGLLHGKMPSDQKEAVMEDFRSGEYNILVSTTVIEVGVDIPNATVMLIEGANRFGLAQLHQLRGRVGRGGDPAFCLLIPETEDSIENERLTVMVDTTNGFLLAEKDLEQRGPGDFIGYRQSGYVDLQMASLSDIRLIEKARRFAQEVLIDDPLLEKAENFLIKGKLSTLWKSIPSDIS